MDSNFIHQFVPGENKETLLLLLHGTGGTETDLISLGQSLSPGTALLSPRGKILENGMPRFFRRLAPGVFDEDDLIARTHELADFIADAVEEYGLKGRKIVALGYSNGANIAASMALLRPEVLSGGMLLKAMLPLQPATLPDLSHFTVFLASGRHDPMAPAPSVKQLAGLLKQAGASVTHHWEDVGHELYREELEAASQWLTQNFPTR